MFAPSSRIVTPKAVFNLDTRESASSGSASLTSGQSGIYYDFGLEVGGVVTIQFSVSASDGSDEESALGIAFTEATNWIGPVSDKSSGLFERNDGALYANFSSAGDHSYIMPDEQLRGGFRYMTLFLVGASSSVTINNVSLELSFQPTWSNLRAYKGYFHSDDDLLNKIWYSGAYVSIVYDCTLTLAFVCISSSFKAWVYLHYSMVINMLVVDSSNECSPSKDRTSLACAR